MKSIFLVCVAVIGGLFLYSPKVTNDFDRRVQVNKSIAPELLECKYYQKEIENNLRQSKEK